MNRREALKVAAALATGQAATAQQTKNKNTTVIAKDLTDLHGDWNASMVEIVYPPGGGSESHRHPGHVFVYVLKGELVTKLDDGETITYKPGQGFYELPMHLHTIAKNASQTQPAKFLAFLLTEKGKPLTVPK